MLTSNNALKRKWFLLTLVVLLCYPIVALAEKVIGISDGDTMTLLVDGKPLKIRLSGIDAPEKKQAFGQKSKESLSEICWGSDATYEAQTIDRYGRTVAVVFCNGIEANKEQVRLGMAWVYEKFNRDKDLKAIENFSRNERNGLWQEIEPIPPWKFRSSKR